MMREEKRLKLSIWRAIDHYFIVFYFLMIPGLFGRELFLKHVTGTYTGTLSSAELITYTVGGIMLALAFYIIQRRRLRFREVNIQYSEQDFQEAVERTVKSLGWTVETNTKHFFRAYRPWNWTSSWGEMISIVRQKDKLLLNSICDPNKMSSVASYGWNKKNINTFLWNLADAIDKVPAKQEIGEEEPVKEWTLKRILIRLYTYPFCLIMIGFGYYLISEHVDSNRTLLGLIITAIALAYLYSDLKVLLLKNNKIQGTTTE